MNSANKDYFHDLLTQPNERVGDRIPAAEVSYTPGGFFASSTVQEALDAAAAGIAAGGGGGSLLAANNLSDLADAGAARSNLGLGTLATQNGTFSGTSSGTNTGDQDLSGLMVKANNLSDVANPVTAQANLGLGSMAVQNDSAVVITGGVATFDYSGLRFKDNAGDNTLIMRIAEDLTLDRVLNITVNDGTRNLQIIDDAVIGNLALTKIAPATSQTIPAGYSAYVVGPYEIATGFSLEIGAGSCLEIG